MANADRYQIHTEARGPHWVAWLTRDGETKPDCSVVLVAASDEEATARAEQWRQRPTERGDAPDAGAMTPGP